jgi:hypothetical protein
MDLAEACYVNRAENIGIVILVVGMTRSFVNRSKIVDFIELTINTVV